MNALLALPWVGFAVGCRPPAPPPVVAPAPAGPAEEVRASVVGPVTWTESGGLSLDVPYGWSGTAGSPPVLLDLIQAETGFGLQIRAWLVGEEAPPRLGYAVLFEDVGAYRTVPVFDGVGGTRTWQADDGRTIQAWYGDLGNRTVEVALLFPLGRATEGRAATEVLLRSLRSSVPVSPATLSPATDPGGAP